MEGVNLDPVIFWGVLKACASVVALEQGLSKVGMLKERLVKMVLNLIFLWVIASLTCMPNVGIQRMLGEYSIVCPFVMQFHGLPCMHMPLKLFDILTRCVKVLNPT